MDKEEIERLNMTIEHLNDRIQSKRTYLNELIDLRNEMAVKKFIAETGISVGTDVLCGNAEIRMNVSSIGARGSHTHSHIELYGRKYKKNGELYANQIRIFNYKKA